MVNRLPRASVADCSKRNAATGHSRADCTQQKPPQGAAQVTRVGSCGHAHIAPRCPAGMTAQEAVGILPRRLGTGLVALDAALDAVPAQHPAGLRGQRDEHAPRVVILAAAQPRVLEPRPGETPTVPAEFALEAGFVWSGWWQPWFRFVEPLASDGGTPGPGQCYPWSRFNVSPALPVKPPKHAGLQVEAVAQLQKQAVLHLETLGEVPNCTILDHRPAGQPPNHASLALRPTC